MTASRNPRRPPPRNVRVEVFLPPLELEGVRDFAERAGLTRRVPGVEAPQGNVSALVRAFLQQLESQEGRRLLKRLRATGWDAASLADVADPPVRVPIRMSSKDRDQVKRHAKNVGMIRGGRGDISAFLRAMLRLGCGL